ncbi:uncharacterized protein EI97DRAFT_504918 [Westerdykella ornata]|uniref:DUF7735 domain-containing protein n=1 Tax=Westerdykella ornata TaxID=318751 RepID=A0A6A6J544_WESOR|nr:uncharacterized protein EI97DRAFT_504918 [Westerdykella ornata]KAF2271512.1 hypothetical protein EI97DRAFT_504918 [Westerdykella ornata]
MPDLSEIDYSEDATVAAFRDYYRFLTMMYLDESLIQEPPEGGWPHITPDRWKGFDKTEEVFSLLRHLPYVTEKDGTMFTAPEGPFANYSEFPDCDGKLLKQQTELEFDYGDYEIPPHIIGLVMFRRHGPRFLLDTKLGVVYWFDCPGPVKYTGPEQVGPDVYDWEDYIYEDGTPLITDEKQAEWRASGGVWTIPDFFEMLKFHFRELNFVPIGSGIVTDIWIRRPAEKQSKVENIQQTYRAYVNIGKSGCRDPVYLACFPSPSFLKGSPLSLLLPTATPTGEEDMWNCALSNYSPFFNPPKPTGTLLDALNSYGDKLLETCTEFRCPYPDATKWCGFTTAVETAVLPAYTSYASSASLWWANHSALAIDLAERCPHYWYKAATDHAIDAIWLNQTIINAECFAKPSVVEPSPTGSSPVRSSTLVPSRTGTASSLPSSTGVSSASSTVLSSPSWIWRMLLPIWLVW